MDHDHGHGPPDAETTALIEFRNAQRAGALVIIDDLPALAFTSPVLPSGWTPIGFVEHLGYAETARVPGGRHRLG